MTEVRVVREFPRRVDVREQVWIPLADGTRLAARIWLPDDAEADPVPAVLEYLPYRLNDGTASGDHQQMGWFAGHGYAGVRVDIRGTGESDGVYATSTPRRSRRTRSRSSPGSPPSRGARRGRHDGLLLERLQRACRSRRARPPALQADRHRATRATTATPTTSTTAAASCCPWTCCTGRPACSRSTPCRPDPAVVGDGWREQWLERLDGTPPFIERWLAHQRRDAYWQQGSVRDDYARHRLPGDGRRAAGPTATPTPCCGCWRASTCRGGR